MQLSGLRRFYPGHPGEQQPDQDHRAPAHDVDHQADPKHAGNTAHGLVKKWLYMHGHPTAGARNERKNE